MRPVTLAFLVALMGFTLPPSVAAPTILDETNDQWIACTATALGGEAACALVHANARNRCQPMPGAPLACWVTYDIQARALTADTCFTVARPTALHPDEGCGEDWHLADLFFYDFPRTPSGGFLVQIPLETCVRAAGDATRHCETRRFDVHLLGAHYACGGCYDFAAGASGLANSAARDAADEAGVQTGLREAHDAGVCHAKRAACATARAAVDADDCVPDRGTYACDGEVSFDLAAAGGACHFVSATGASGWTRVCTQAGEAARPQVAPVAVHVERPSWSWESPTHDTTDVLGMLCTGEDADPGSDFPESTDHVCVAWLAGAAGPLSS